MTTAVAHHFDDAKQQQQAASLGMWVFLASEVLFFGGMFAGYAVYRGMYAAAFAAGSRHLDVWLGTLNTALLLTSSLTVALSIDAIQRDDRKRTLLLLMATMLLGASFLGIKGYEYQHKFHEHLVPGRDFTFTVEEGSEAAAENVELFFSFYFAMTGVHALHMVIGIGVFAVMAWQTYRRRLTAEFHTPIEMAGLYWHFVDIIWVLLFPLLYLIDLKL